MFERYTEDARKVIFFARYEASLLGSPIIETEHLWLGLLRQSKKLMRQHAPKVTADVLLERLKRHGTDLERVSMAVEVPLSEEAKRALANAVEVADTHGQRYITAEYLVLALLRDGTPSAAAP
jgi:ATP-dependent Clp protease ATP-binding subunit ClpC